MRIYFICISEGCLARCMQGIIISCIKPGWAESWLILICLILGSMINWPLTIKHCIKPVLFWPFFLWWLGGHESKAYQKYLLKGSEIGLHLRLPKGLIAIWQVIELQHIHRSWIFDCKREQLTFRADRTLTASLPLWTSLNLILSWLSWFLSVKGCDRVVCIWTDVG